jgi:UDPglucose--hexose-1-phosphate uridylyltransferase
MGGGRQPMTELRKDIFSGRWVIIEQEVSTHPAEFQFQRFTPRAGPCQFCEGREAATPPELYSERPSGSAPNGPGWTVRVVPSRQPRLRIEGQLDRRAEGFHDLMNGLGAHEVIIETPHHDRSLHDLKAEEIAGVVRAWLSRITDLRRDQRIRYVLVFKNHGGGAGARSTSHSISQLMALPVTPRALKNKLQFARAYFAEKERCVYCDVMAQERDDGRRLISENADFVAFAPFASRFAFEMLVLPKRHASDFTWAEEASLLSLGRLLQEVLGKLERTVPGAPYNLSLHNCPRRRAKEGYWATLDDDFHWHLEILPQIWPAAGFEWASGFFYNPVSPEAAARLLAEPPGRQE